MSSLLWFLLIGLAAGWLAGTIMKGSGFGLIGNLVVGVIGALLGGFIFDVLSIQSYGLIGSLVMSVVGAVALLALIRVIKKA
ncbi:GlsB/YeaQ/YmgE family stress response membrane protein [bacterium]|nr:MAG: GlsB/YeaQ/YmgE family stress response membrane protein [candidate division KSB1 bacterium]MCE7942734.1 GlsB/YeaQ/YmgE family stress response membrane protein [Chlorobi bacterium CHB1]MCL4709159.1 GlsB/YeaQ/YmgE family stress response membrane protein [bacterium]MDL1876808.1 GlsB/YeaQ/YmgE family stress response membrane protein [Cytophagia bacterium CHB2]MBC6946831.1 GlsB/YeaQ/YmgE family stress response membrane protein [candidate division KSB1 bacterium]